MKTFIRRLAILDYLRSARIKKTTDDILNHLLSSEYFDNDASESTLRRSVQRDLNFLYGANDVLNEEGDNEFGLDVERGCGKSLVWSLDPYATLAYDFEKMPTYLALSFAMTQKHLSGIMPKNTRLEMERFFKNADIKLQKEASKISPKQFGRLKEAVEFYQRGQRLQAAHYDITILDTIYRAILKDKQLNISYRGKDYRVHPYGVVILLPKLYLVAKKNEDIASINEFRHFLIHKIEHVEVAAQSSMIPEDFKLKRYLDEGNMDVFVERHDQKQYQLILRLTIGRATNLIADLTENPISDDQKLVKKSEVEYELSASVRRTVQLKNWIMGLGRVATIVSPDEIRDDIKQELKSILKNYL